jgi:PAS domain S-box-containing protein
MLADPTRSLTSVALAFFAPDGRLLHWNEALSAALPGGTLHPGSALADAVPAWAATLAPILGDIAATSFPVRDVSLPAPSPDGPATSPWGIASFEPLVARSGYLAGIEMVVRPLGAPGPAADNHPHARLEAALRESEDRFRLAQETALDGFMLLESVRDAEGRIVDFRWQYANPAAERIIGKPAGWFAARQMLAEMPGNLPLGLFGAYVHVVETGEPWSDEVIYELDGLRVYLRLVAAKAGDGFVVSFADLSERRRAEERLRESEANFRTMADNIAQFAWMADASGNIFWYNQRWYDYTGTTLEEMRGWGWTRVHHPDHAGRVVARIQHSWDTGEPWEDTFPLRGKDGTYRWFLSRALPIHDEQGRLVRWFGTNTDITAQRAAEEALRAAMAQEQTLRAEAEEANRLKDEFLATVSHELRTPLTAFLGYAELLKRRKRDEAYIARTVDRMVQSARTQAQLIEDLLDISRIISGRLRVEPHPLALEQVIAAALDTVRPAVEAKGLAVTVALDPEADEVVGDRNRLQQVVWNLLANAVKFTPAGGRIDVELRRRGADAELTVRDTGRGISVEFLPHVFERFRQADSSSNRAFGGLGLGLAIVKHLVELHGGTVTAASAGAGCGASFTVRLPLAHAHDRRAPVPIAGEAPPAAAAGQDALAGTRLLVVDDQPDLLELFAEILAGAGAEVRTCTAAQEALGLVGGWRPDVLVSDIAMPGEDGYWLIAQVRALPREAGGATPAVALTAYVRLEDRLQVLSAGFQSYVPKPVEPAELVAVAARLAEAAAADEGR